MKWKKDFGVCVPYTAKRHLVGDLSVFCEFIYATPRKTPETAYKADIDNLAKSALDAMQDCGVFVNDRDVVELHAVKRYGLEDGIRIRVTALAQLPAAPLAHHQGQSRQTE